MTKLWQPTGNERQTQIDIQIALVDKRIYKAKLDIAIIRKDLDNIIVELDEIDECLHELKKEALIVSIMEYAIIQNTYERLMIDKKNCVLYLDAIEKTMNSLKKEKDELTILRQKAATKILEFKYDRFKKRPKGD